MAFYGLAQNSQLNVPDNDVKKTLKKKKLLSFLFLFIFFLAIFGIGAVYGSYFYSEIAGGLEKLHLNIPWPEQEIIKEVIIREKNQPIEYVPQNSQEERVIKTVRESSPAVVSIIISKDVPIMQQYYVSPFQDFPDIQIPQLRQQGTQKQEVGGGSGIEVSS